MTREQFRRLIDIHGADPGRWPQELRSSAEALIASSVEARDLWLAAQRLESLFMADRLPRAGTAEKAALTDAALAQIRHLPRRGFDWRFLLSFRVEAALAASLLAGLIAGFEFGPALAPPPQRSVPAIALLLGGSAIDLEGLL